MDRVRELVNRLFENRDGELRIGGVPIRKIAPRTETPFFVYDHGLLTGRAREVRAALPDRFDLYYSIKANPNQSILRTFLGEGCGLEIASAGELFQALSVGCPPSRILFAGPGKSVSELEYAVESEIGEIHAESIDEIETLARLATSLAKKVRVAVRVNPAEEAQGGAMRMGGKAAPFGVDEEILDDVLAAVMAQDSLVLAGVHLFVGTQILDFEVLGRQYSKGLEIARRAAAYKGAPLETVDFGGGLGIPYYPNDRQLDLAGFGRVVSELVERDAGGPEFEGTRFVLEPGRFLVGEAGVYVSRVIGVKHSRGKTFVIVDGGMHHHLAASGNLGQVIKRNFPVAVLNKLDQPAESKVDVVGPLCTPLDVLARDIPFPAVKPGDLVGVFQSGAYARAASPLGFLSHVAPTELLVNEGRVEIIRRRGSLEDSLRDQPDPDDRSERE